MQFVLFTTPLSLESLDPDSRKCPICKEPYAEYQASSTESDKDALEWAIRVDMLAAIDGQRRCCGHVFGKRCLQAHIKSPTPWHNKCPLCRSTWFTQPGDPMTQSSETQDMSAPASSQRRVTGVAASGPRRPTLGARIRRSANNHTSRLRPQRSPAFIQQVLAALEVEEGSDEVKASVEEVEQALARLYRRTPGEN